MLGGPLLVVNVSESGLLGLVAGLAATHLVPADAQLVVGAGFLGGYTTFSGASVTAIWMLEQRR